ncbi:MAG: hypothetical protein V3T09_08395 [bacterium]
MSSNEKEIDMENLKEGDIVEKTGGDYYFYGVVISVLKKITDSKGKRKIRYVVQNKDGMLHIFNRSQLNIV